MARYGSTRGLYQILYIVDPGISFFLFELYILLFRIATIDMIGWMKVRRKGFSTESTTKSKHFFIDSQ